MTDYQNKPQEEELYFHDLIDALLIRWHWFVVALIVFPALALGWLWMSVPVYKMQASVLLSDDKRGGNANELAAFQDLAMLGTLPNNIENEILVFKSNTLALRVIEDLQLDVSIFSESRFKSKLLYTDAPITLKYITRDSIPTHSYRYKIKVLSASHFSIAPIDEEKNPEAETVHEFGKPVAVPFGTAIVTHNPRSEYTSALLELGNPDDIALWLSNSIDVSLANKNASVLNISMQGTSRQRSSDIINSYIRLYNEDAINDKNRVAHNTAEFIDERLIIIRNELGGAEKDIETYKKDNKLSDVEEEARLTLQKFNTYETRVLDAETQMRLIEFVSAFLNSSTPGALIPANLGISDDALNREIARYNDLSLEYEKMQRTVKAQNPVMLNKRNELEAHHASIVQSVGNLKKTLGITLSNLKKKENLISGRVKETPKQERELRSVIRDKEIKEQLYIYLLEKREETQLSMSITAPSAKIIDAAWGTNTPVSPRKMLTLLFAVVAAFIVPSGAIFVINMFNTKIRDIRDVEKNVTAPIIGEIPSKPKSSAEIVMTEGNREGAAEAFRMLRTNLDFMTLNDAQRNTILITSTTPGEGKTYVSCNLALALAQSGKRVVLLGLDIRKPALHRCFAIDNNVGVTTFLSGKENSINTLIKHEVLNQNLDVIPAGPVPPNPSELLLSHRTEELINYCRTHYDYVVIDSAPAKLVSDTHIIAKYADVTLYVMRAGHLDKRILPVIDDMYCNKKLNNMGLVVTDIQTKRGSYGYGYGYGYSYGH
ncbi:MAG: GumC family protein [Tannerellaceae bacterium]